MEAVEFIRTLQKLCTGSKCYDCPLEEKGRCIIIHAVNPEESVRIVEEYAKEHPEEAEKKRTNKDVLLAAFPNARMDYNGIPYVCPGQINEHYNCDKFDDCLVCRCEHWFSEVEE